MLKLKIADPAVREWMTEQLNIVEQMNHLLSYPYIREKYNKGELNILGWYYIIGTGEVFNYQKNENKFVKIEWFSSNLIYFVSFIWIRHYIC